MTAESPSTPTLPSETTIPTASLESDPTETDPTETDPSEAPVTPTAPDAAPEGAGSADPATTDSPENAAFDDAAPDDAAIAEAQATLAATVAAVTAKAKTQPAPAAKPRAKATRPNPEASPTKAPKAPKAQTPTRRTSKAPNPKAQTPETQTPTAQTRKAQTPKPETAPAVPQSARRPRRRSAEQIGRTALGPRPVPALTAGATATTPSTKVATLDSGLQVIAVRKPGTPLVEVRLRIPFAGQRVAPQLHSARAELLAATIMLGTTARNREQVDADLAYVGGHLDASVDAQRLMISGSALSTGLPVLLDVLADTLTDAAFRATDVRGEQLRLHEQLVIALSQPSTVARMHLQKRRFGDHPAAWDMPLAEDLDTVTPATVRAMFRRQVVPAGSTLVLVGDLSPTKAINQVAKALGTWVSEHSTRELTPPPAILPGPIGVFDNLGAVQSQVRLSAPAVSREHDGYPAQQLANLIYGGYFSSRLVENIREDKGYTYGASSSTQFWPSRAAITIGFDTNTESTAAAVWEAQYELGRLALTPPTAAEVESARNYALGTLAASLATQAGYASMITNLAGYGLDAKWLADYRKKVAAVGVDEVHALARTVFAPAAFMGVVVGDLAAIESDLATVLPIELA